MRKDLSFATRYMQEAAKKFTGRGNKTTEYAEHTEKDRKTVLGREKIKATETVDFRRFSQKTRFFAPFGRSE